MTSEERREQLEASIWEKIYELSDLIFDYVLEFPCGANLSALTLRLHNMTTCFSVDEVD